MARLLNLLTIKARIALVSVAFIVGLGVVAGAYLIGSGEVADAFGDAKALVGLQQRASEIAAIGAELKSSSRDVRFRKETIDVQKFADGLTTLSQRVAALAGAPEAADFAKPINTLKIEIDAIAKQFADVRTLQKALGDTGSGGLLDRAEAAAEALLNRAKSVVSNDDSIEAERMVGSVNAMRVAQSQYSVSFDDTLTGDWEVQYGRFENALKKADLPVETKEPLGAAFKSYADAFKAVSAAQLDFMRAAERVSGAIDLIGPVMHELDSKVAAAGQDAGERLAAAQALTREVILVTLLLAFVVGLVSSVFVGRTTARPLGQLRDAMLGLAGGDLDADIPALSRSDEIGQMARAVAVFKDAGLDRVRLEREALDQRQTSEATQQRNEAERAERAREQELVVAVIARGHEELSRGNLTHRIADSFPPAYEKLKEDFNAAIAQLERTLAVIARTMRGIRANAEDVEKASDDLSHRTEQQAASLEETAAALSQITATVKNAAEGANHARTVVAAADGDAKRGAQVVRQAVDAMGAIEKSAQQISRIIGVIDEIAFQTNLLALNAGVEAARAGDAGRGFAVVAAEVRALAQRSAEAAKEIKGLISASTAQVGQGVARVAETGAALERIMTKVTEVNGVIGGIAAGAKEQAAGLDEVNVAVGQMDQMTQENAAMVNQSTATSRSLSHETAQLADLISQFRLGDADGDDSLRRELQKAAPHAFAAPARAPRGAAIASAR